MFTCDGLGTKKVPLRHIAYESSGIFGGALMRAQVNPSPDELSTRSLSTAQKSLTARLKHSRLYLLSAAVLFVVLVLQYFISRDPITPQSAVPQRTNALSPFSESVRRQEAYFDQLDPRGSCAPKNVFTLPISEVPLNMALVDEVNRMAAEFELGPEALNKNVKYFLEQMDEGLNKQNAMMAQIPTYVTAVPNGTEKVY